MSIHRRTPERDGGYPRYCIECEAPSNNSLSLSGTEGRPGYAIISDDLVKSIFICDDCLKNARKVRYYSAWALVSLSECAVNREAIVRLGGARTLCSFALDENTELQARACAVPPTCTASPAPLALPH